MVPRDPEAEDDIETLEAWRIENKAFLIKHALLNKGVFSALL